MPRIDLTDFTRLMEVLGEQHEFERSLVLEVEECVARCLSALTVPYSFTGPLSPERENEIMAALGDLLLLLVENHDRAVLGGGVIAQVLDHKVKYESIKRAKPRKITEYKEGLEGEVGIALMPLYRQGRITEELAQTSAQDVMLSLIGKAADVVMETVWSQYTDAGRHMIGTLGLLFKLLFLYSYAGSAEGVRRTITLLRLTWAEGVWLVGIDRQQRVIIAVSD